MADELQTNILIRILDAFTAPLRALGAGLGSAEEQASRVSKRFQLAANLNQAAEGAGRFGQMIRGPLEGAVKEFIGFERQMSQVQALTDLQASDSGLAKLKDQALELGAATAYSAEEAAQAQAQYAQAGRSVNEILAVTPMTLAAAKANGTGLAETAAIIGHTMSGMGIKTSETARVVDVLTAAAAASDANLTDMGQALAYVGPVARQSGMSLEMTAAYIGKLKDAGLESTSAGTGLRAVIARLLDPSREATRAFAQMGIKAKELAQLQKLVASGKLDQALTKIGKATEGLPDEKRIKLLSQIFGIEASTAANIAISATMDVSEKGLGALNAKLHDVDGTTERLAKVMEDNLGGSLERAGGAVSGLSTKIGEILKPTVEGGASAVEGLAGSLTKWAGENPKATRATLELVAGLGALSFGIKGVLLAASTFTAASAGVQAAFLKMSTAAVGFNASTVGVGLAALAAGYAVGTWANETFGLADKISSLLGRSGPKTTEKRGIEGTQTQALRGGWVRSKTGLYTAIGMHEAAPKDVQEAQAAGAGSLEEINTFIAKKRAGAAVVAPSKDRVIARLQGAAPKGTDVQPVVAATNAQTDALLETLRKQEGHLGKIAAAATRPQSGRPAGVTGT